MAIQLNAKQSLLMASGADEIMFGGGVGSSKTFGLVIKALNLNNVGIAAPTYRGLILRKSYEDLETVLALQRKIYPQISQPAPAWKKQEKHWEWSNGARVEFGYLQTKSDLDRYTGNQYDFIGVEEVADTIPSVEWWDILSSRVRSDIAGLKPIICGTTNPRGKGVPWIMARFAIAPDGKSTKQRIWREDVTINGETIAGKYATYEYIQSLVTDNTYWDAQQKADYIHKMAAMPENIRQSLLYGRWDATSADDLLIHPALVAQAATVPMTKDRKEVGRRVIGIDPAHQGKDNTAIIHRKLDTLFNLQRFNGLDTMQLVAKIRKLVDECTIEDGQAPIINIDYAMGTGAGDRLKELGIQCNIINFASKPYDPEKYLNKRAEMYGEMAEAFNTAIEYRIPPDAALIQQLSAVMIDRDSSSRLKLAPKSEIKKSVGRSPDEADAAALTYAVHVNPVADSYSTSVNTPYA